MKFWGPVRLVNVYREKYVHDKIGIVWSGFGIIKEIFVWSRN
jgi:hypothetical protein